MRRDEPGVVYGNLEKLAVRKSATLKEANGSTGGTEGLSVASDCVHHSGVDYRCHKDYVSYSKSVRTLMHRRE